MVGAALALFKVLLHTVTNGQYGYFRDELYYLASTDHLAWGYPDHSPLSILLLSISRQLLGDSLGAIRFLPALAGGAKVLLTALLVAELGGGSVAAFLAGLCVIAAPVYLVNDTLYSMNSFEAVFWMGVLYCALRAMRTGNGRWWLAAGACAGLGLQNKHSTAFFLLALAAGLLIGGQRHVFKQRWFWLGAALALALFLPNLIWQASHGWPTLELLQNVKRLKKNVENPPPQFLLEQALMMLPPAVLVWAAGIWWTLTRGRARFAFLGCTYLVFLVLMMALKAKNYYLAPIYPMLFAAGALFWAERRTAVSLLSAVIAVSGAVLAPVFLPILSPDRLIAYQQRIGFEPPKTEHAHQGPLPQYFGDQFGWPEMVAKVAEAWNALPAEERAKAAILAGNYGEAGAIDLFGGRHGLPKAIAAHQSYWLWGWRGASGDVLLVLQRSRASLEAVCSSVEEGPRIGHPYAMGEEHFTLRICRGLKQPPSQLWPRMKHWN